MIAEAMAFLFDRGKAQANPILAKVGEMVFVPPNYGKVDMTEIADKVATVPRRKVASVTMQDTDSFCRYWGLHHTEASVIFADADVSKLNFLAVLDYHGAGDTPAGWREHRALFELKPTPEWATWLGKSGNKFTQIAFAEFIEDNAPDIFSPDKSGKPTAAEMLEVARDLQAKSEMNFASAVRQSNGQNSFSYQEQTVGTVGKGRMEVPEAFVVRMVPYIGAGLVEVTARLRYRIAEGKLVFWYDLLRPSKVIEQAFDSACARIAEGCGKQPLLGRP